MKKLSDRAKRLLTIVGIGVVCVGVIIGISYQLKAEGAKDVDVTPSSSASSSEVIVPAVGTNDHTTENAPASSASSQLSEASSKADQVIQPDVSKPAAPSSKPAAQGSATNPSKAPTYSSSKPSEPSGGETKDGKVYLPGFGWVTNTGGSGTTVNGDGDVHKQVGTFD